MKSIVNAFQRKMDGLIANRKNDRKEITPCQERPEARLECGEPASWDIKDAGRKSTPVTKRRRDSETTEPDTEMMQSAVEHQEVPREHAAVTPVKGRKKRRKATRRPKGTDPRRLWIPEEVGCRLQEGVPSYSSSTAQEKYFQKNSDRIKLWTAQGIGRRRNEEDPPCKSGMAQAKLRQEGLDQEPGRKRNPETTKGREETVERPGMQQRPKEHRPELAATGPRHKTATAS
jgi:hypothetical protein